MKVRLLLGYPSKYRNYTSKKQFGQFPHSPRLPPVDNFFTLHLTTFFIEDKRCRIRLWNGLYTCLISVFINNKRAIYEFWIFELWIFLFSNIAILAPFDPKLPFLSLKFLKIVDEITLTHTGWSWKVQNVIVLLYLGVQKFIACTNIQIHVMHSIFIANWFFLNFTKIC